MYYRELARASASGGEVVAFLVCALQGLQDGLATQLDRIRQQTEELVWQRLVHEAIPQHRPAAHRRRQLAIALFNEGGPVPRGGLTGLSANLMSDYAGTSSKTLTRDIHELENCDLIARQKAGYAARNDLILGLMPRRALQL